MSPMDIRVCDDSECGMGLRGGWMVDCEWKDGKPVKVELRPGPNAGHRPVVRFKGHAIH